MRHFPPHDFLSPCLPFSLLALFFRAGVPESLKVKELQRRVCLTTVHSSLAALTKLLEYLKAIEFLETSPTHSDHRKQSVNLHFF